MSRALAQKGHSVRVAGVYPPQETAAEYEEDQGVRVWRLRRPRQRLGWIAARYRLFQMIRKWAVHKEIDIVEVPDWEGYTSLWPRLPVPVITRLHGSLAYFAQETREKISRGAFWLESRAYHRADECTSCSLYTARRTSQIFGDHSKSTTVLYNSVALSQRARDMKRVRNHVVFAGSLTPKKGIVPLIKAWPQVRSEAPDAELHIYGKDAGMSDGSPMMPYLESLLSADVRGSVHFHGHVTVSQLRDLYARCSLAVFPSYSEAFAVAPLEAMAEGCAVICSNRSSGPELIAHRVNGFLVNPDREAEISQSILELLRDSDLAHRLGVAGRETIEQRFSSDRIVGQFIDFYAHSMSRFHQNGTASASLQ
jgi:glycosyltransferase involved in cell wall biosynthesis